MANSKIAIAALTTAAMAALAIASGAHAATAEKSDFGTLKNGSKVTAITLTNHHNVTARIITFGAMLQSLKAPDRDGKIDDIVIGYDTLPEYEARNQFTGVTVGRYANRIAKGKFSLDGKDYQLAINNPPNSLHGGPAGFWSKNWTVEKVVSGGKSKPASVTLKYVSPDGEEGYPGTMTVHVTYSLNENNDVTITYKATTDKPTILNLTNHSLFNLGGVMSGRSALEAKAEVEADTYLPTDDTAIPTGESAPVKGTAFDFTTPTEIGPRAVMTSDPQIVIGHGIDHNFNIRGGETKTPKPAVNIFDEKTGRGMKISTTEPGIQFYSGNFLDGMTPMKGGHMTNIHEAVAFEAQHYPDSPNHPAFPSTRLNPGQTYTQVTVHHLYTMK
ncbi:MAG: aldose epimerase family protein [Asticcacaulis sp.]